MTEKNPVVSACVKLWSDHKSDCSGFVRAVATALGVPLSGNADQIVSGLTGGAWSRVADGKAAKSKAEEGYFVVAGLKGMNHQPPRTNGHVAVVVPGELAHGKYPKAFWGSLGSVGEAGATLNYSWSPADRDRVVYAARSVLGK